MIRVRNITLFFLCLMIFLNGIFLVFTTESLWPNVLLLFVPIIAVLLVDVYRVFHISSIVAGAIGFVLCGIGIYLMVQAGASKQLGIVSALTTYLLLLLVFQRKSPRLYWQLAILSVLQTVVASVYSGTLQQGAAYVVYYAVILVFLSLVSIYRDQLLADGALDPWHNLKSEHSLWWKSWRKKRTKPFLRVREYKPQPRKLSLLGTLASIFMIAALSVCCGMGFFGAMPNRNRFVQSDFIRLNATIGVSQRIDSLETDLDPTEDSTEVLRVKFFRPGSQEPTRLSGDIYLPRVFLEVLGSEQTSWDPFDIDGKKSRIITRHPESIKGGTYHTKFSMYPDEEAALFAIRPMSSGNQSTNLLFNQGTGTISRPMNSRWVKKEWLKYEIETFGAGNGQIAPSYPFRSYGSGMFHEDLRSDQSRRDQKKRVLWLKEHYAARYPTLVEKAKQLRAEVPVANSRHIEVARKFEQYLRDSGEFSYTTQLSSIQRDKSLDPVEDFAKNFKKGHCQLYASALAIMLRSVGIPARVVVGYRTNKYVDGASYYSVERRHGHAWVEAYISPFRCTEEMFERGHASPKTGAWLRLDGTPEFSRAGFAESREDVLSLAQSLLDDYIEGFEDTETDQRTVWQKLKRYARLFDLSGLAVAASQTGQRFGLLGQIAIGLCLLLAVFWWRLVAKREDAHRRKQITKQIVASPIKRFFGSLGLIPKFATNEHWAGSLIKKFDQTMVKAGFAKRKENQTISEYVSGIRESAIPGPATDALFSHLNQLTFLIYQLRFGGAKKGDLAVREAKHMLRETVDLVNEMKKDSQAATT